MKSMDRDVLLVFPEEPTGRFAFVSKLPVRWKRSSVDHAIKRLMNAGLLTRESRGVYTLTDAGRAARDALMPPAQKAG